ncbi:MAG: lipoprotein 17-related variable surface protein [Mycoplasma sp.]|nr:lipoprotein 17-related variable surface protein [Mycoplasma sp.]
MKRKIALIFGTLAVTGTVATIASCGSRKHSDDGENYDWSLLSYEDKDKYNSISSDDILQALQFIPSETTLPGSLPKITSVKNLTINGVKHVNLEIKDWVVSDQEGTIGFGVSLSLGNDMPTRVIYIKTSGWDTIQKADKRRRQELLDNIPSHDILNLFRIPRENTKILPSLVAKPSKTILENKTITILKNKMATNLSDINLAIISWTPNDTAGTLTIKVTVSKPSFKDKTYTIVTHWKTKSSHR